MRSDVVARVRNGTKRCTVHSLYYASARRTKLRLSMAIKFPILNQIVVFIGARNVFFGTKLLFVDHLGCILSVTSFQSSADLQVT